MNTFSEPTLWSNHIKELKGSRQWPEALFDQAWDGAQDDSFPTRKECFEVIRGTLGTNTLDHVKLAQPELRHGDVFTLWSTIMSQLKKDQIVRSDDILVKAFSATQEGMQLAIVPYVRKLNEMMKQAENCLGHPLPEKIKMGRLINSVSKSLALPVAMTEAKIHSDTDSTTEAPAGSLTTYAAVHMHLIDRCQSTGLDKLKVFNSSSKPTVAGVQKTDDLDKKKRQRPDCPDCEKHRRDGTCTDKRCPNRHAEVNRQHLFS